MLIVFQYVILNIFSTIKHRKLTVRKRYPNVDIMPVQNPTIREP